MVAEKTASYLAEQLAEQNYSIAGTSFIVQTVFKKEGTETFSSILFRLMQSEMDKF